MIDELKVVADKMGRPQFAHDWASNAFMAANGYENGIHGMYAYYKANEAVWPTDLAARAPVSGWKPSMWWDLMQP